MFLRRIKNSNPKASSKTDVYNLTNIAIAVASEAGIKVEISAINVMSDAPKLLGRNIVNIPAAPESALAAKTINNIDVFKGKKTLIV